MNQHVDKAMELRNEMPMVNNCAQTIMRVYADELGMNEEQAAAIGCQFWRWHEMWWYLWSNHKWTDGVRRYGHRFAKKLLENIANVWQVCMMD